MRSLRLGSEVNEAVTGDIEVKEKEREESQSGNDGKGDWIKKVEVKSETHTRGHVTDLLLH